MNLTALLVIATLFISVSNSYVFYMHNLKTFICSNSKSSFIFSLPRTSSIKMIDAWLLFTLLIPFAEVLLHTRIEQLRQKLEQMDDINNAWGKDKDKMISRKNNINKKLR